METENVVDEELGFYSGWEFGERNKITGFGKMVNERTFLPLDVGRLVAKLRTMWDHGLAGMENGWSRPAGDW